jgi:putative ABC transport system ATP-binding protein
MLEWRNVSLSYGKKGVLSGFSLKVASGEKVILYGKSGGGKSSLLRLFLGFVQPDKGELIFDGKKIDEKSVWEVRKSIAYVSQDTDIGEGNVNALVDELFSLRSLKIKPEISDLLLQLSLTDEVMSKDLEDLSGGEKQRIASCLEGEFSFLMKSRLRWIGSLKRRSQSSSS